MIRLCRLIDVQDGKARGFLPDDYGDRVFVVRRGEEVFVYLNTCPHQWIGLDYAQDKFLSPDGSEIMCFAHGAHFDITTGRCMKGVCEGQSLIAVPWRIEEGWVMVPDPLPSHPTKGAITD